MIAFIISILLDFWQGSIQLIKWGLILLVSFIGIFFLIPLVMMMLGYRINGGITSTAEEAAKKQNVLICNTIFNYGILPLGPTTRASRRSCIHTYASITHDPSVCELLMPSSYGWDCVGAASDNEPCSFGSYSRPQVNGNGIVASLKECTDGPTTTRNNECCLMAKVKYVKENNDCTIFKEENMPDQCHHEVAKKNSSISECSFIKSTNIRTACEVEVRALGKKTLSN